MAGQDRVIFREGGLSRTSLVTPGRTRREAGIAHRQALGDISPANTTLFVHSLIGDGLLVEAEADAWAEAPPPAEGTPAGRPR